MAATYEAPLDIETGMPFLVIGESSNPYNTNYHHPWFPKRDDELLADLPYVAELDTNELTLSELGGIAVRMSRGQITPIDLHVKFHQQYLGPKLPSTLSEKFIVAVKGCSGVVPRTALDVTAPEGQQLIELDDRAYERLASAHYVHPEHHQYSRHKEQRRAVLSDFFMRYALMQDLNGAPDKLVDRFLNANNLAKRSEFGNYLLRGVLDASVAPVMPIHAKLRKQGLVAYGAPSPITAVKKQILPQQMPAYRSYLADRLLAA